MDTNGHEAVAGGADPGNGRDPAETAITDRGYNFPNSMKVYVAGTLYKDGQVPFREISLAPTKTMSGEIEVNESVRVYDTSGPWGDPAVAIDVERGLPALRREWILGRGDVEEIEGRVVRPADDGWLSDSHAAHASRKRPTSNAQRSTPNGNSSFVIRHSSFAARKPVRAKPSNCVTQLAYARRGIITPEMEFIAIRENRIVAHASGLRVEEGKRDACSTLFAQHRGESFGASIPDEITAEF